MGSEQVSVTEGNDLVKYTNRVSNKAESTSLLLMNVGRNVKLEFRR